MEVDEKDPEGEAKEGLDDGHTFFSKKNVLDPKFTFWMEIQRKLNLI